MTFSQNEIGYLLFLLVSVLTGILALLLALPSLINRKQQQSKK